MNGTAILAELLTTPEGKTLEFKRDTLLAQADPEKPGRVCKHRSGRWSSARR